MTIYAMFSPKIKMLIRGNYKKSFDVDFSEKGLRKMLGAIKLQEKTIVFIDDKQLYIKARFSPDFNDFRIERKPYFDKNSKNRDFDWISSDDYIECEVMPEWWNVLGKTIFICNNRKMQVSLAAEYDICTFLYSDVEKLKEELLKTGGFGIELTSKMFLDDGGVKETMDLYGVK